jgi:ribonuclease VapC
VIVVDTSALIAVFRQEEEAASFLAAMETANDLRISAGNFLEFQIVSMRRAPQTPRPVARLAIERLGIRVVPVCKAQADLATEAYRTYGKGRHRAALNFGDCFAYALAKHLDAPLLFKGDDFAETDIPAAARARC